MPEILLHGLSPNRISEMAITSKTILRTFKAKSSHPALFVVVELSQFKTMNNIFRQSARSEHTDRAFV